MILFAQRNIYFLSPVTLFAFRISVSRSWCTLSSCSFFFFFYPPIMQFQIFYFKKVFLNVYFILSFVLSLYYYACARPSQPVFFIILSLKMSMQISNCCIFFMCWSFYHYKMAIFISVVVLVQKYYLILIQTPLLVTICIIYFSHLFIFNLSVLLDLTFLSTLIISAFDECLDHHI